MLKRFIKANAVKRNDRPGYFYRRLVDQKDNPYNALHIIVAGRHDFRRVTAGIRNYFVSHGRGTFTVEGKSVEVEAGDLVVIRPGEVYAYEGRMDLFEFNIDTGDGIAHQDLE